MAMGDIRGSVGVPRITQMSPAVSFHRHDGGAIWLSISERFAATLGLAVEIVNLGIDKQRAREAQAAGVTRLPSRVIGGRGMRPDDDSPIECLL